MATFPDFSAIADPKLADLVKEGRQLPLMEHFYTIQGEGEFCGRAAYFLRLGGCDVGCVWCDVKESWPAFAHPLVAAEQMADYVAQSDAPMAVITGGEPCHYELGPLTDLLKRSGAKVHLETSGAYPISGSWDWVCLSPKKFKAPLASSYALADELKVVVYHVSDFEWAEKHAKLVDEQCLLLLQPEWSKRETMMPKIIDYVQAHPEWKISLQTHKYLGVD